MALFGSGRDASFIRHINKELVRKYIDTEVEIYNLSLEDTQANIYDESTQKYYYNPVRISAIISKDNEQKLSTDSGIDSSRIIKFGFVRDLLTEINLVIEEGAIISWNNEYYEVDLIRGSQLWGNRNPDTHIGTVQKEVPEYGYSTSIVAECHLTRQTKLNLVDIRSGTGDVPIKRNTQRNKSIYD